MSSSANISTANPLLVVYDYGAAGPAELVHSLRSVAPVHFVASRSAHVIGILPMLEGLAPVHLAAGDINDISDECGRLSPAGVVTFSERAVRATARLAACLGLPYNSVGTSQLLTDKCAQRDQLNAAGGAGVKYARLDDPSDWPAAVAHTGLPLVIKPRVGEGSRNTYYITDADDGYALASHLLRGPESRHGLIVEEYLMGRRSLPFGDYVSVESAAQGGVITHIAVTGKFPLLPPFRECGQFWPSPLGPTDEEEVTSLVTSALRAVNFSHGISHTEVKLTPDGPRIIEINGRLGGFMNDLSRRASGLDLIELAGRIALGQNVDVLPPQLKSVLFQFSNLAPAGARRILAVHGREQVRKMVNVDSYNVLGVVPRLLDIGVGSQELDLICGRASTHHEMFSVINEACAALTFSLDFDNQSAEGPHVRPPLPCQ